ncbi:hypothetical protein KCU91_g89, partial [Aureobasidium melanogenum]
MQNHLQRDLFGELQYPLDQLHLGDCLLGLRSGRSAAQRHCQECIESFHMAVSVLSGCCTTFVIIPASTAECPESAAVDFSALDSGSFWMTEAVPLAPLGRPLGRLAL